MKKILALSFLFFLVFIPSLAQASGFDTAYIRLESKANSALETTVCAKPSSAGAGVENKLIILFPDDFNLSTSTGNWIATTTDIPSGATPWPLAGSNPTNVSGQTVTFSTTDLTLNNLYCFNLKSSLSTTGSAGHDKTGTITTKTSSNVLIDQATYGLSVLDNNQISVTASVDANTNELPIQIESETPGTDFPQDTVISYKITYGSNASGSIPLTIEAQWTEGTIQGSPAPSVEILDYVVGSASNAYGGAPPVVDTVNRIITWEIPSIPGGTLGQTITFKLKTNSAYTGPERVDFDVSARAISGATVTPDETVFQTYLYDPTLVTPTPTESQGSGGTSSTPTPTPILNNLAFTEISINSISKSDASIFVSTNKNANFKILYGTSYNSLSKSVVSKGFKTQALLNLTDLDSDTKYFFKIIATDENGKSITSDIFTFQTAQVSELPRINPNSLFVTSGDNVIFNPSFLINKTLSKNLILLPVKSIFAIQLSLEKILSLKKMQAVVRKVGTFGTNYKDLIEIAPGIYTGELTAPGNKGNYEVYVKLFDYDGNITEQKLSDLSATNKLSVFKKGPENTPIENARLVLYLYNKNLKIYQPVSSQILPIKNPSYSKPDGTYDLVLPLGQYKAEIQAIGFDSKTVIFKIENGKEYPQIYLNEQNFNIINTTLYYLSTFNDTLFLSQNFIKENSYSNRLFDLISFVSILVFVSLTILSISARTHISPLFLPFFLILKLKIILFGRRSGVVFGKVINIKTGDPVSKADVSILSKTGELIKKLKTNKLGEFYFHGGKDLQYKIKTAKKGFEIPDFTYDGNKTKAFPFVIEAKGAPEQSSHLLHSMYIYTEDFLGTCMEAIILLGIIVEIYFVFTFGILRVAPFLALTLINLLLIFTFLYKPKSVN